MNLSCLFGLARRVAYYIIKEYCICKLKGEKTLQHLLLFRVMFNSFLTQRWTSLCSIYFVTEINENCSSVLRKRKILLNLKLQLTTWFSFYWFIRDTHTQPNTHTHTHSQTHTHTQPNTHTHTHTQPNTHTHTQTNRWLRFFCNTLWNKLFGQPNPLYNCTALFYTWN